MPQVRYGPDITDDAARLMNNLTDFQKRARKKGKLTKRERAAYKRDRNIAKRLFGLTDKDIDRGNFKLMQQLAQYGVNGRDKRGRAYKKNKYARNKRTGAIMRRSVKKESEIASLGQRRRTYTKDSDQYGGASFLGRTTPKKLEQHLKQFDRLQKKRGGASYMGRRVKKIRPQAEGGKEDVTRLLGGGGRSKPSSLGAPRVNRPRLVKQKASAASKRAKGANTKRKATVKKANRPKRPKKAGTKRRSRR